MERMRLSIFALAIGLGTFAFADSLPPMILHSPPRDVVREGGFLRLTATVVDDQDVARVLLHIRTGEEQTFRTTEVRKTGHNYELQLVGEQLKAPEIAYFWEAADTSGNIAYLPKDDPRNAPFKISVEPQPTQRVAGQKTGAISPPTSLKDFHGSGTFQLESVSAEFPFNPTTLPLGLMERRPGEHLQYNVNLTSSQGTTSDSIWLYREVENFTGIPFDKFRWRRVMPEDEFSFGDFFSRVSDLTLSNVEMRGVERIYTEGGKSYHVSIGRTQRAQVQSDQTSPQFRQFTFSTFLSDQAGGSKWTYGLAYTFDDKESIPALEEGSTLKPTSNALAGLKFETTKGALSTEFEGGVNLFDKDTSDATKAGRDFAGRLILTYATPKFTLTGMARRIGAEYLSAGQLETFADNDRQGWKLGLQAAPGSGISLSASREEYRDNLDGTLSTGTTDTTNDSATLTWTPKRWPSVTLSIGRLQQEPRSEEGTATELKTRGVTLSHSFDGYGVLGPTSQSFAWQRIFFESTLNFNILYLSYSLNTSYMDKANLTTSYQFTKTEETATTRRQVLGTALQLNLLPFEFLATLGFQIAREKRTDATVNLQDRTWWISYHYIFDENRSFVFEGKRVKYEDFADRENDFRESILTVKFLQAF